MKKGEWLDWVELNRMAQNESSLSGVLTQDRLTRIAERSVSVPAEEAGDWQLSYEIRFRRNENRIVLGEAQVNCEPVLRCQRCLEPVACAVESQVTLAFVSDDKAAEQVPRGYEPVVGSEQGVDLLAALEDEVLLALPMFPAHEPGSCEPPEFDQPAVKPETDKKSPFADLAKLIKNKDH